MDVTNSNFGEALSSIKNVINKATFIAIDEEMTGIFGSDVSERIRRDDTPGERYERMTKVALKYRMIQFGLCIFIQNGVDENGAIQYIVYPYNFYLFPESDKSDFVMSISAIEFLKENGMDFGKLIHSGVPYISLLEKESLRSKIFGAEAASENANPRQITLSKDNEISMMKANFDKLDQLLKDMDSENCAVSTSNGDESEIPSAEYVFEPCNSYLRRYIYQVIENTPKYKGRIVLNKSPTVRDALVASVVSTKMKEAHAKKVLTQKQVQFQNKLGFTALYELLSETCVASKIPLIGHNCLFDLMFLYRWMEGTLPNTFSEFTASFNEKFPCVFDTKYMADNCISRWAVDTSVASTGSNKPISEGTTLQTCYEREVLSKVKDDELNNDGSYNYVIGNKKFPRFTFAAGAGGYEGGDKFHDAGWDAYCTGCVFAVQLYLMHYMHRKDLIEVETVTASPDVEEDGEIVENVPKSKFMAMKPALSVNPIVTNLYGNKLFMMRSMYHMSIAPSEGIGGFIKYNGGLFYLSGFEPKTSTQDMASVLTVCKGSEPQADVESKSDKDSGGEATAYTVNDLYISWVDDHGAFVHLENLNEADCAHNAMEIAQGFISRAGDAWPENWKLIPAVDYLEHKDRFVNGVLIEERSTTIASQICDAISSVMGMSNDCHDSAPAQKKMRVNE